MAKYTPRKGDFISLTFDPQSGHEQKGRRPALVISNYLTASAILLEDIGRVAAGDYS